MAESDNNSQILFVYMRLKDNVLTLEKTKVVEGNLKRRRDNNDGDMYFEITSDNNNPLLSRLINKPGKIPYDYIENDGQLRGGISEQPEELIIIKVPFDKAMKNISFYSTKPSIGNMLAKTRLTNDVKDTLIASFPLGLTGEVKK